MSYPSPHIQWLGPLSIVYHLCGKNFIESSDDGGHLVRHPVVPQQPSQNLSSDTVEGLFEMYKVDIQGGLPLDALLHNNPQCCYSIRTASASSEARLFIQHDLDALQDHFAKKTTRHVQQHDATLVFTVAQITFLGQLD